MQLKLYSESSPLNPAFTGTARQVYASPTYKDDLINKVTAGSVAALVGADLNGIVSHIFAPKVDRNFDGVPENIVGNANDAQGEFSLRVVPVADINYFITVEAETNCEISNRAPEVLSDELLRGTAWDGSKNLYVVFWPNIIALFHGKEVPYDSVITDEGRDTFRSYSPAHGTWATANKVARDEQGAIGHLVDKLTSLSPEEQKKYLCPPGRDWTISPAGSFVTFGTARSVDYPEIATQLRSFFAPPASDSVSRAAPAPAGQPFQAADPLQGYTINVRSPEDDQKDITAKIGETKSKLYLIGANANFADGTIDGVSYPVLSAGLDTVHSKPRSARPGLFQSLLQQAVDVAKSKDVTSIYSTLASLHVVQRPMATNLLMGSFQVAPVTDLWADTNLLDGTAYMGQYDPTQVERLRLAAQNERAQETNDIPESRRAPPKTYTEKIGCIQTTEHFKSLTVNHSNIIAACVNVKDMIDAGAPCLHLELNKFFIQLMGSDFQNWERLENGGGTHVHLTLFKYWDAVQLNIAKFATNFENINVMESGRPASELDVTYLKKAVAVTKHAQSYFYGLIACGARDTTALTIAAKPIAPAEVQVQQTRHVTPSPAAPKRLAPVHKTQDFVQPAARRIKVPTAPQFDPAEKGLLYLRDTSNQHPFPSDIDCCAGFVCKGMKCPDPGHCTHKHVFRASTNVILLEKIGDHFLATDSGWFDKRSFRGCHLKDKYKKLFGNKNGPFRNGV